MSQLPDKDPYPECHIWAPELYSLTGGIQSFSRQFIDAVKAIPSAQQIRVLLKNETVSDGLTNCSRFTHSYGNWPLPLRTPRFAVECLRWAKAERPKLIVATHLHFGPLARVAKRLTKIKYILIAHGFEAWQLNDRARIRALQEADLILSVSRFTRDSIVHRLGVDSARVEILPNTFSPARFSVSAKSPQLLKQYGLDSRHRVILTVCRLAGSERYKGYDRILHALPAIRKNVPSVRYLLVGSGPDRPRIESLAQDLGVRDAVIFAGFVPDEQLRDYYNLCDLFAMPSKAEGFGIVFLEALACGRPVLAGNKDGSCDALADGELGLLVDPDNLEEIAVEIVKVLQGKHPHPYIYRREYLQQRVTELFGFQKFKQTVAERLAPFI